MISCFTSAAAIVVAGPNVPKPNVAAITTKRDLRNLIETSRHIGATCRHGGIVYFRS
jgi:hypothetical protein